MHSSQSSPSRCLLLAAALAVLPTVALPAQSTGPMGGNSTGTPGSTASGSAVQAAQTQLGAASSPQGSSSSNGGVSSDSYKGSLVAGKATGTTLDLSLDEALQRGLRQNLGVILSASTVQNANGQRLEQLQSLLPTVTGQAAITVQQINLAAYGLKFPGLKPIIGPFQTEDFRAYLTQKVLDVSALQNYLSAKHNFAGAKLTAQDARDMVILTVGNAYLLCIADSARITAVQAELATSKVSLDQAIAAHDAGTSPKLDVLRAQVDYQNEQQSLISTTNQLAKDKLALARTIGLPLDQDFRLTDLAPYKPLSITVDPQAAFEQALKTRKDLAGAEEQSRQGEAQAGKAAARRRSSTRPSAHLSGDFGDIGTTVGHSHGTYSPPPARSPRPSCR